MKTILILLIVTLVVFPLFLHFIYLILKSRWIKLAIHPYPFPILTAKIYDADINYSYSEPQTPTQDSKRILLIHGIGANLYCWRKLHVLLAKDHYVWSIDLRGFGGSDKSSEFAYDLPSQATLVLEFLHSVIGAPATLVASSMGGAISIEAALKEELGTPRRKLMSSLVLLAPAYDSKIVYFDPRKLKPFLIFLSWLRNPWITKFIVSSLYGTKKDTSPTHVMAYLRPYLLDKNATHALLKSFACLTDKTLIERMPSLKIPIQAQWGTKDNLIPVTMAETLKKLLPHSEVVVFEGAGHHIQEEEPEWVYENIQRFLIQR